MCGTTDVLADPVRQACSKKNLFRVFGDHLAIGIPIPIHHFVSLMFKQPIQTTSVQNELRIFFGSANLSLQSCPHWVQAPGKGGAQKFTLTTGVWFFFRFQVLGSQTSMDPWNSQPMNIQPPEQQNRPGMKNQLLPNGNEQRQSYKGIQDMRKNLAQASAHLSVMVPFILPKKNMGSN